MLKPGSGTKGTRRSCTDIASRRGMSMRFGLMALFGYLTSVIVQVTGRCLVKRMVVDGIVVRLYSDRNVLRPITGWDSTAGERSRYFEGS